MTKKIGIKKIETTIPNDVTIFKISDIEVNESNKRTKVIINAILDDLKIYNVDDSTAAILSLSDGSGKICGLLVGNKHSKINNLLETLVVGKEYHIGGIGCFLDQSSLKELDDEFKKEDSSFIKDIFGDMFLAIRAIEVI